MFDRSSPTGGLVPVLIVFFALLASACVPAYEQRLAQHRAAGDLAGAENLLASAATRAPADPNIIRETGIVAFQKGETGTAIAEIEKSLALAPDDLRAEVYLGAAYEKEERWAEAEAHYRRASLLAAGDPELAIAIGCQQKLVVSHRLTELVAAGLDAEKAGTLAGGERFLILPFSVYGTNQDALSLRLGLAAVASADWTGSPAAVPFAEVDAFLAALDVAPDTMIDAELRDRLARLTGARYVLDGQLSVLRELVSTAPVLFDRGAPARGDGAGGTGSPAAAAEMPLPYQQQHIGALVELEQSLLLNVAAALGLELPPTSDRAQRFSARSGQSIALYGEALFFAQSRDEVAAAERLAQVNELDPDFARAHEIDLHQSTCPGAAGDPSALLEGYEHASAAAQARGRERDLLAGTTETVSRVGGAEGESEDYSINRSAATGSVGFPVRLPR